MNMLAYISGVLLLAAAWFWWSATRLGRGRARLRRLYARQGLTASVTSPETAEAEFSEAPAVDDRQMNLFTDLPRPTLQMPSPVPQPRPAHPLRRRTDRPASERLDWQYFNKDSGDLAYPAAKDRRKPAATTALESAPPRRRA